MLCYISEAESTCADTSRHPIAQLHFAERGEAGGLFSVGKLTGIPFFERIMLSLSSFCSVVEVHRREPLHEHADIVEEPSCFNQTDHHISKGSFK